MIGYLTAGYALGQMIGPSIAGTLASYTNSYQYALVGASLVVMLGGLCLIGGIKYDRSN